MKIVSLLNSGESLDKAIALIDCAFKSNPNFYRAFERIYVFYCNDLTKKKGYYASGSIKSFIEIQKQLGAESKYTREYIINRLIKKGFISFRMANNLEIDNNRFSRLIQNIPWYLVFDDECKKILCFMKSKYSNVEFINIGKAFNAAKITSIMPYYSRISKLYLFLRDGNLKAYRLGKNDINLPKVQKIEKQSIFAGGNVYLFIILIADFMVNNLGLDCYIGYRPASRFKRKAYDRALEFINDKYMTMIEPKNVAYNAYYTLVDNSCGDLNFSVVEAAFLSAIKEIYGK